LDVWLGAFRYETLTKEDFTMSTTTNTVEQNTPKVSASPSDYVPVKRTPVWTSVGLPDINATGLKGRDKILAKMEAMKTAIVDNLKNGVIPWRHQLDDGKAIQNGSLIINATPKKVITGEAYQKMNFIRLQVACAILKYSSNWFGTVGQWKKVVPGLHCIKGTHPITLFAPQMSKCIEHEANGDPKTDANGKYIYAKDSDGEFIYDHTGWAPFYVMNLDDMDPQTQEQQDALDQLRKNDLHECRITYDDKINIIRCPELDALPGLLGCNLIFHDDPMEKRSFYRLSEHAIYMPKPERFKSGKGFYAVLLHELVHSTKKQLNRPHGTYDPFFGPDDAYAREELVAEFTCISLMSILGMHDWEGDDLIQNSSAYMKSWLTKLQSEPDYLDEVMYAAKDATSLILDKLGSKFSHLKLSSFNPKTEAPEENYGIFVAKNWAV